MCEPGVDEKFQVVLHQVKSGSAHVIGVDRNRAIKVIRCVIGPCQITADSLEHVERKLEHVLGWPRWKAHQLCRHIDSH